MKPTLVAEELLNLSLDDKRVAKLLALCTAATRGPVAVYEMTATDFELFEEARTAIPDALREISKLKSVITGLKSDIDAMKYGWK